MGINFRNRYSQHIVDSFTTLVSLAQKMVNTRGVTMAFVTLQPDTTRLQAHTKNQQRPRPTVASPHVVRISTKKAALKNMQQPTSSCVLQFVIIIQKRGCGRLGSSLIKNMQKQVRIMDTTATDSRCFFSFSSRALIHSAGQPSTVISLTVEKLLSRTDQFQWCRTHSEHWGHRCLQMARGESCTLVKFHQTSIQPVERLLSDTSTIST